MSSLCHSPEEEGKLSYCTWSFKFPSSFHIVSQQSWRGLSSSVWSKLVISLSMLPFKGGGWRDEERMGSLVRHKTKWYTSLAVLVHWPELSHMIPQWHLGNTVPYWTATFPYTALWHNKCGWKISHQTRRLCEEHRTWGRHWEIAKITVESLERAIIINWKLLDPFLAATKDLISYLNPCNPFKQILKKE